MTAQFLAVHGRVQRAGLVVHIVAERFTDLSAELHRLRDGMPPPPLAPERKAEGAPSPHPDLFQLKSRDFH
jgi:error-prone DNA polymerase